MTPALTFSMTAAGVITGPRRAVAAGLLAVAAPLAAAQTVEVAPGVAQCLQLVDGRAATAAEPEYPFEAYKGRERGEVTVTMTFTRPDRGPSVDIDQSEGGRAFVRAVRRHVEHFRLPCMGAEPVVLRVAYAFKPDERPIFTGPPRDVAAAERARLSTCIARPDGERSPPYPPALLRANQYGRILAQLRFTAADQPPVAQVHGPELSPGLKNLIKGWVHEMRMPCLPPGAPAFDASISYVFKIEGTAYGFKPGLSLKQLLALDGAEHRQQLPRDSTAMACPFDVQLTYQRPAVANRVAQVGDWRAERKPLLDWLAGVTLNLDATQQRTLFGDTALVTIPCYTVDDGAAPASPSTASPTTSKE